MDLYEQAVMWYVVSSGQRFICPQFSIPSDTGGEWSCPDFVALDFQAKTVYEDGMRSYAILPLVARDRAIGVLTVASTTPNQYTDADVEFLREAANQIALAVENMSAYEEIAALKARLEYENVYLQEEIQTEHNFVEMVGSSPALLAVLRKVEQVAATGSTVLISGETGTGKEPIARAIRASPTLDLSDVSFVGREGIGLLRDLRARGVAFLNCSPFVAEQLKAVATVEGEHDDR
jgi:GAF domain-containing protein